MNKLNNLFSPYKIKNLELKNRAIMPAMGTVYSNIDNTVSDRLVAYTSRRARGGSGLIITEICAIDERGKGFPAELGIWSDDFIPGLSKLAGAVHKEGARSALQLHHAGRETFAAAAKGTPEAPSTIPSVVLRQKCEEMSTDRIGFIVKAYADGARRAKEAGFDAVEVHGAHGYLITQFLSPLANQRSDSYGGSDENRSRFMLEILRAVRSSVGSDFPVIIRISADEATKGGYDINFMKWLAPQLVKAGADVIHASVGVMASPGGLSVASMNTEANFNIFRAKEIKSVVDVPVIAVGRIEPQAADDAIARGDADLVAFGRANLADPDYVNKVKAGNIDDIRKCVSCNQGCIDRISFEGKPMTCTFNPECGREYLGEIQKSASPKNVWVIGGGPAGISAAMYAAKRGHKVELFDRGTDLGGQIHPASMAPHKEIFYDWFNWAKRELAKENVKIHCSTEVDEQKIRSAAIDYAVIATGALPSVPEVPGIKGSNVYDARDVLMGTVPVKGSVVILGAGFVGMETADFLIEKGVNITMIEMNAKHPVKNYTAHEYWLHYRLRKAGVETKLGSIVTGIEGSTVNYKDETGEHSITADSIVTAMGAKPETDIVSSFDKLGIKYKIVGDAVKPRRLIEAIHEGALTALDEI